MKKLLPFLLVLLLHTNVFSQDVLQGDHMLDLIGKPLTDPLYLQLKQQEGFINNYIDRNSSVQIDYLYDISLLNSVTFFNGWVGIGSGEKYGTWYKQLPFDLSWNMTIAQMEAKLGKPVYETDYYGLKKDYNYKDWKIKMEFVNGIPVRMTFENEIKLILAKANQLIERPVITPTNIKNTGIPVNLDTATAAVEVNWPALKDILISCNNLKPYVNSDSVDYFTETYYGTSHKAIGFERTAIKFKKKEQQWYYEAFYKTSGDTIRVRNIFTSLLYYIDKAIKDNTGKDFALIGRQKKPLDASPVVWLYTWTMPLKPANLPEGIGPVKITLLLVGMKNAFKNDTMDYTIKLYIDNSNVKTEVYTWDKPL